MRRPLKVWNLTRANQMSEASGLKVDTTAEMFTLGRRTDYFYSMTY